MKIKLDDFKKLGWDIDKKFNTASKNNANYSILYCNNAGNSKAYVYMFKGSITEIQLDIDDISTAEEIEITAENMYQAIKSL